MEQYLKNFKKCLQKEIPFCAAECPFHIDIPDFIEKMKRGGFKAAFKTYRNAVGFPVIASNLCPAPCKGVCPRKETDSAIELPLLEQACVSFTEDKSPTDYNLPMKKKKVAVIGAGISGLSCALRLCMKKYEVEIFEKSGQIGGILWSLMEPDIFLKDLEEQFQYEKYILHLNTPVRSIDELEGLGFDAVYAATGTGGEDFGLIPGDGGACDDENSADRNQKYCAFHGSTGWFAGGGLIGDKPVYAMANGLHMGTVIDNFLKTGNLLYPDNRQETKMCLDPEKLKYQEPVIPADGTAYDEEEAKREAARCIGCQCDFCRTYCDLTDFYNKWPLRIRDEIMATTLPGSADVKATPAKRLLSTCNQCGLCLETCPEDIDIGGLILAGRKSMHRQKKAPWVFHDFWLRDMDFANGESASISKAPVKSGADMSRQAPVADAGQEPGVACTYAFFPGCQLGASDPELVKRAYGYLLGKRPDTGLMLRCCGAPAEWSGDEEKFNGEVETVYKLWRELGKPTLILACPTCEKKFKTYMADIPVISLYEVIADWGIEPSNPAGLTDDDRRSVPESSQAACRSVWSVFDACASRHEEGMKKAVRLLAEKAGCKLEPMVRHDAFEQCCGYGGQPGVANPEYAGFVARKRIAESENPYITYCINCRDIFADAGKETVHILEFLFGDGKPFQRLATVSERRENRVLLKRDLLKEFWNIETAEEKKESKRKVRISGELKRKLSRERILEEDVIEALEFCEQTGRRVYLPEEETYSGYKEIGYMTYWVEYRMPEDDCYELVNVYAHRMRIEIEAVWNGKRIR